MFLVSSLFFFVWFPCGRLSWLHVSFWAHVNIVQHIISYVIRHQQQWSGVHGKISYVLHHSHRFSLLPNGKMYAPCARSYLIYNSETWPTKWNLRYRKVRTKISMIRWDGYEGLVAVAARSSVSLRAQSLETKQKPYVVRVTIYFQNFKRNITDKVTLFNSFVQCSVS